MAQIKVEVYNQERELVYGNEGNESRFRSIFENEIAEKGFDGPEYQITWTDVSNNLIVAERLSEYKKEGLSFDSFVEMMIDNDASEMAEYRRKRNAIKTRLPKV